MDEVEQAELTGILDAWRHESHKMQKSGQWWGKCQCGRWEGYLNRYGSSSYAVHLLVEYAHEQGAVHG